MDTSTIIWIIVAGAAMLLSQPNRKKRRRPSTPEGEQPQQTAPQQPDATGRAAPTGRHADTGIAVAAPGLSGHLRREAAGHGPDGSVIPAGQRPPETPNPQTDTGPTYGQPH